MSSGKKSGSSTGRAEHPITTRVNAYSAVCKIGDDQRTKEQNDFLSMLCFAMKELGETITTKDMQYDTGRAIAGFDKLGEAAFSFKTAFEIANQKATKAKK